MKVNNGEKYEFPASDALEIDDNLILLKGIYNRVVSEFTKHPLSFELSTYVDAPPG